MQSRLDYQSKWRTVVAPWCAAIEREFARAVFNDPDRFHRELDLSGMIRGDYPTKWASRLALAPWLWRIPEA